MGSRRGRFRLRNRKCRKVRHTSMDKAKEIARLLEATRGEFLRAYWCAECKAVHLTSQWVKI